MKLFGFIISQPYRKNLRLFMGDKKKIDRQKCHYLSDCQLMTFNTDKMG